MSEDKEGMHNPITPASILDKMAQDVVDRKKFEAIMEEDKEDYINAINRIFASEDGQYFLNKLIRYCGINSFDNELNPAKLIEVSGKRKVWLELIRPFLDKTILIELD